MTIKDMPIGTSIYYWYWNTVFDLTYLKIMVNKKNFWIEIFKNIKISYIIKRLIFLYFDISYFLFKLIKEVFNNKENDLEMYLFSKFSNPIDDRMIIRFEEKWLINGTINEITQKTVNWLKNKKNISTSNIDFLQTRIYIIAEKHHNVLVKKFDTEKKLKLSFFTNKRTKSPHWGVFDVSKNNEEMGYLTDQKKAEEKFFYGEKDNVLIEKIEWEKKTCLFNINKSEIKFKDSEKFIKEILLIKSADVNGYNERLLKEEIVEKIDTYRDAKINLIKDLKNEQLDEWDVDYIANLVHNELIEKIIRIKE
jgi:hypothetical protein